MGLSTALGRRVLRSLATPHGIDRYTELVNPMLTVGEVRGRVTRVHHPTPDTVTLTVRPNAGWRGHTAGQFVRVTASIDGVRRTRCYSPSNAERAGDLEFSVRAHPGGLMSQHLYHRARPGMVLGLSAADGEFRLPTPRPERTLLVSGGSGITPVLSMLRTLCLESHSGEVVLLHYARDGRHVPHRAELAALDRLANVRVVLAGTREPLELNGKFHLGQLRAVAPWFADAQTFLCGPPTLTEAVHELYTGIGIADRLHTEAFTADEPSASDAEATGTVHFVDSGVSVANDGQTLLRQAEAAGLRPEHGCRMGICFSCTKNKAAGSVRDAKTGEVSAEQDEQIQLCISLPAGDVSVNA